MKTISGGMQTHLDESLTTLTFTIHLTRLDGVEVFASTFNRRLTIGVQDYEPFGFIRSDVDSDDNMGVGTTELTGILDSDTISEADLAAGRWDFAAWEAKYYNWNDLTMTPVHQGSGSLGVVRAGRLKFVAELLGLMQAVQISILNLTSPVCIHELGDHNASPSTGNGCTVDLEGSPNFTVYGAIESMDSDYYGLHDSARTEPDGSFSNGKITFLPNSPPGLLDGMSFEIRGYIVGQWVLFTAVPYDATGYAYKMTYGCDKSRRMCIDRFDNILDRLASDYTQGNDAAIQVARHND